jgi:hypothetical protein
VVVSVGDPAADVIAPLVFLALVMASWALQPYRASATVTKEREALAERNRAAFAA